jgi:hypothetical protein
MHGAGGGIPKGEAHPAYRRGGRSQKWGEMRKYINELVREAREIERLN